MSYRKITVDGKEYEYVVGKDVTKVKGVGIFKHIDWAYYMDERESRVSPKHVEGMIRGKPCPDHNPTNYRVWDNEDDAYYASTAYKNYINGI